MKSLISLFCAVLFVMSASAQDSKWYFLGGISLYDEDLDALVGSGIGTRIGLGAQFNEMYGIETIFDNAKPADPSDVANALELSSYEIETTGHRYLSTLLTASFAAGEKGAFVGKVGFARYWAEAEIETQGVSVKVDESGTSAVAALGYAFSLGEDGKNQIELGVTQYFEEDVKSLSTNLAWKYNF